MFISLSHSTSKSKCMQSAETYYYTICGTPDIEIKPNGKMSYLNGTEEKRAEQFCFKRNPLRCQARKYTSKSEYSIMMILQ